MFRIALVTVVTLVLTCGCAQRAAPARLSGKGSTNDATILAQSPPPTPPSVPPPATNSQRPASTQPSAIRTITAFEGLTVHLHKGDRQRSWVEVKAKTCLEAGWLEQIACVPQTREHEALMVVLGKPSHIHAALLMAGFERGSPGRWTHENNAFGAIDPTGDQLDVLVRYQDATGKTVEHSVRRWIRDPEGKRTFPNEPWIFGGSRIVPNPPAMGPGEHYVADFSGSVIGLVTFGDEVIGWSRVLADQESVQEPLWEANVQALPPVGTDVILTLRRFQADQTQ